MDACSLVYLIADSPASAAFQDGLMKYLTAIPEVALLVAVAYAYILGARMPTRLITLTAGGRLL
jgi:hypothetical protein